MGLVKITIYKLGCVIYCIMLWNFVLAQCARFFFHFCIMKKKKCFYKNILLRKKSFNIFGK